MDIKYLEVSENIPADEIRDLFIKNGMPEQAAGRVAFQIKKNWRAKTDRAFVISPVSNGAGMMAIPEYCREVEREVSLVALSPHMNLGGMVIDQKRPDEMAAFNAFVERLIDISKMVIICGTEISDPLYPCVLSAMHAKKPIRLYDERLYPLIRHIAIEYGVQDYQVITAQSDVLSMPPEMLLQRMSERLN